MLLDRVDTHWEAIRDLDEGTPKLVRESEDRSRSALSELRKEHRDRMDRQSERIVDIEKAMDARIRALENVTEKHKVIAAIMMAVILSIATGMVALIYDMVSDSKRDNPPMYYYYPQLPPERQYPFYDPSTGNGPTR